MTEKLYYIDSHIHEFEATILECESVKNGYALILDRSAFFPEGGGQAADTGFLNGIRVKGSASCRVAQESGGMVGAYIDTSGECGYSHSE